MTTAVPASRVKSPQPRNPASSPDTNDDPFQRSLDSTVPETVQTEGPAAQTPIAAPEATISLLLFHKGQEPTEIDPSDIARVVQDDDCFVWADLSDYAESDLTGLAGGLKLDPAGVRAALAGWQRPRMDVFRDHFYVSVTIPRVDPGRRKVQAGQLDLFIGRNVLVSAHKRPLPFADRAFARARQQPDLLRLDSAYLLSILLSELIEHYEGLTEGLEDEIEAMEERALRDTSDYFLEDLLELKRFVFALGRLAGQHREIFGAFLRPEFPFVAGEEMQPYFRDLEARLDRLLDQLTTDKDAINGASDLYVSQVGHRSTRVMQLLTVVSTIFLPVTLILGFFSTGFEFRSMYSGVAFGAMIVTVLAISGTLLTMFYRRGWVMPDRGSPRDRTGDGASDRKGRA
jgi:magnesium transporter